MTMIINPVLAGGGAQPDECGWIRPAKWLPMPELNHAIDEIYILCAVYENGLNNTLAISFSGSYSIDWGDGNTTAASGTEMYEHEYTWGDIPAQSYIADMGYRQVICHVTAARNVLQTVYFNHNASNAGPSHDSRRSQILDIYGTIQTLATLQVSGSPTVTRFASHPILERFHISTQTNAFTVADNLFARAYSLQSVSGFDFSSVTTAASAFETCAKLRDLPLFDFSHLIMANRMFNSCTNLNLTGTRDFSSVKQAMYMFYNCYSQESIDRFIWGALENITALVSGAGLRTLNGATLGAPTGLGNNTFQACLRLERATDLDFSKVTFGSLQTFANSTLLEELTFVPGGAPKYSWGVGGTRLNAAALNAIFAALPVVSTAQTITITQALGAPDCDRSIATAKGWTVAG